MKKLKLKVLNQFFTSESKNQVGLFDAIHMSEVLEHIPSPKILLKNAYDNLINFLICISVPNDYNPIQLILKTIIHTKHGGRIHLIILIILI